MAKIRVTYMEREMDLSEACKMTGAKRDVVRKRLNSGWKIEDALNTNLKVNPARIKPAMSSEKPVEMVNCGTGLPCD